MNKELRGYPVVRTIGLYAYAKHIKERGSVHEDTYSN